jgi:transcriptional regulator with AAA-type ATPase domain/NAD-dependent dihydropyrimidine dehydrogenase PreA subunit
MATTSQTPDDRVQALESQLLYAQEQQMALRPYLVPMVRRGVVGNSRYADRLRQDIAAAHEGMGTVLVFGEPGLEKDNLASLVHFGSGRRKEPLIRINCNVLQLSGVELFGRVGGKTGLLEWIGNGSIILNNLEEIPQVLQPKLVELFQSGTYQPIAREGETAPTKTCHARMLLVAEKMVSCLTIKGAIAHTIKVPPLRVRKSDITAQTDYYLKLLCKARGSGRPKITPEALRRLQGYDFPGNLTELESLIERAVTQSAGAEELTEEVFWAAGTKARRFRWNLLNAYPKLRQFLRSPWYPDRINYGFTLGVFAIAVGILLWGPQTRDRNFVLNLFWDWWWLGSLIVFPFLGRIWCSFCPFMIYGEVMQKLSLKLFPRQLQAWPRESAERWGGWFLFGLFALILLWEELWDLQNRAALSAWLLLLITAGAVICSQIFERRFWCRYLCPIGGMNGLFGKLAIIELRGQQGICSASCTTYQCYKGGPVKGEGLATLGCPVYSHPAQLQDNKDCVLCMTCLKACPHRSVELNLRPPGIDLWTTHRATASEVALLFLLFGGAFLHRLPEIVLRLDLGIPLEQFTWHAIVSVLVLAFPVAIAFPVDRIMRRFVNGKSFVELAYGYLPLVLGVTMAHYLRLGLGEGGRVLPVAALTFGGNGVGLPQLVAHPAVIAFLQAVVLLGSWGLAVILTQKIGRRSLLELLPQHLVGLGLMGVMWWVTVGL